MSQENVQCLLTLHPPPVLSLLDLCTPHSADTHHGRVEHVKCFVEINHLHGDTYKESSDENIGEAVGKCIHAPDGVVDSQPHGFHHHDA